MTDGIISSFSDYNYILTSAKIDSGNSGGLAVSQQGCFLGIPSAVVSGEYQNLGVIIPSDIISDFYILAKSQKNAYTPKPSKYIPEPTPTSSPNIDCVGPDGKHLSITQEECDNFNSAWKPKPTASSNNSNSNDCDSCGDNSHCFYGSCTCNDGYTKNYSTDKCEACPANSTGSYGSCTCKDGYEKNYSTDQCDPCPANSTGSYGYCSCNSGYTKNYSTGQCDAN